MADYVEILQKMKLDLKDIIFTFVLAIVVALLLVSFASCKQTKVVTVTEYRDSIRIEQRYDSIYVYNKDSIYIREKGDTVLVDKYHIIYRDRNRVDTCYVSQSHEVPVVTTVEVPTRYIPKWVWWLLGINVAAVIAVGIRIWWKLSH